MGDSSGRCRWVAAHPLAWRNQCKRLPILDECRDDLHQALLDRGCALICLHLLQRRG